MRVARLVCTNGHGIAAMRFDPREHADAWACFMLGLDHGEAVRLSDRVCVQCDAAAFRVEVLDETEAAKGGG